MNKLVGENDSFCLGTSGKMNDAD